MQGADTVVQLQPERTSAQPFVVPLFLLDPRERNMVLQGIGQVGVCMLNPCHDHQPHDLYRLDNSNL
jgi:hypothetical protein